MTSGSRVQGGTVVGIFEHCAYEQETVEMQPGDLLLADLTFIVMKVK